MSDPIITRLPEALEAEAEAVEQAEAAAKKARDAAALAETDQERLEREQAEGR